MDNRLDVPIEVARRNVDKLGIKYDELPQRPFWSSLFGKTENDFKIRVAAKVMAGSVLTGRELTQPEKDALAYHYAKLLATQVYDVPIAIGAGIGFYRYTYQSYGFPFWKPNLEKFNPNKFGPLPEGFISQRAWHALRLVAWYTGCRVVSAIFLASYSISVYMANYGTDPRLQDYREVIKTRINQRQAGITPQRGQPPAYRTIEASAPAFSQWDSTEQSTQDAQSSWPGMQAPQPESPQATSFNDEPYVFDDASPVTASEQHRGKPQQSTQGSSTWDRIRGQARGAQGGQAQAGAWGQRRQDEQTSRGAQDGTSYNFSSGDEEKSYAKSQAQKEFDEMLERERRGQGDGSHR
ncbi:hypothetical protein M406DRAFT_353102 [Cryphonectria parasitica EP155]|uniref:Uncharacterized protein n=1 Tax=Cryphonectria parasitica (strain ATCC 38755 / EP155) TaxID=660469 RepID=A0A9P4XV92_CRYP1|nr:uncharacterized protein M406DRAFT_353102 [Cryphonectria parasitica EP155]KAF3761457.1 hypothetical protein M406DRAFT_353102 [Cryphonectria parasitica EP155]